MRYLVGTQRRIRQILLMICSGRDTASFMSFLPLFALHELHGEPVEAALNLMKVSRFKEEEIKNLSVLGEAIFRDLGFA